MNHLSQCKPKYTARTIDKTPSTMYLSQCKPKYTARTIDKTPSTMYLSV